MTYRSIAKLVHIKFINTCTADGTMLHAATKIHDLDSPDYKRKYLYIYILAARPVKLSVVLQCQYKQCRLK